ncbi:TetR/AcrR family transcriptional regulator [Diaminobutyricibacter sp. McL0618]|uniref:TetR/AcrR family transcriptional regulator n=1 Tax=Leifsonia sp. McL0618 TaxID=3415677 RepID=UPI003CF139AB
MKRQQTVENVGEARTRILDAAESLFAQRGFDATATSAIAEAAAVPKGLLFYYFPSKKDMLASLVGERLGPGRIDPDPLIEPGNPVRSLLNLSQKLFRVQADSDVIRVIVWREQHSHPEVKAKLAAHRRALYATIEKVLAGSLHIPVGSKRLRAAALAWGAIVTTPPLEDESIESTSREQMDDPLEHLTSLAELLCAGLQDGSE